jgi:hypothetical protein
MAEFEKNASAPICGHLNVADADMVEAGRLSECRLATGV